MMNNARILVIFSTVLILIAPVVSAFLFGLGSINEIKIDEVSSVPQEPYDVLSKLENEGIVFDKSPIYNEEIEVRFGGFIRNLGQIADESIKYYYMTGNEFVGFGNSRVDFSCVGSDNEPVSFSIQFPESNNVSPTGIKKKVHIVNYITSEQQFANIPTFDQIYFLGLYDGIDLRYFMSDRGLKYEFIVHPGADPSDITLELTDSVSLTLEEKSVTIYSKSQQIFQDTGLDVFQEDGYKVPTQFKLKQSLQNCYGFDIGPFDNEQILIIDPWFLPFSTFVNTAWYGAYLNGLALDDEGNSYVIGYNHLSSQFIPPDNRYDMYMAKFTSNGTMVYSTYYGRYTYYETFSGQDIEVDDEGIAYICGYTDSYSFSTTPDANDSSYNGGEHDAFVIRLNETGAWNYSTYLGGSDNDFAYGITFDQVTGEIYVVGHTYSGDFPMQNAYDDELSGESDAFIVKYNEDASAFVYSTFIGGSMKEQGRGVDIDSNGYCYVVGSTNSSDFPTSVGTLDGLHGGGNWDGFLTILDPDGQDFNQSCYLGGVDYDYCYAIAVGDDQRCYLVGTTSSANYPKTSYFYGYNDSSDAFLTVINEKHDAIDMSTFFGTDSHDSAANIILGSDGKVYLIGRSYSGDFPMVNPYNATHGGSYDAYVMRINAALDTIEFSTYIGGEYSESGTDIAVDLSGSIYITGSTSSGDFPTVRAYRDTIGGQDGFLTKLAEDTINPIITLNSPDDGSTIRPGMTIDLDITDDWFVDTVQYCWDNGDNITLSEPYDIPVPSIKTEILQVYVNDSAGHEVSETYTFVRSTSWLPFSTYLGASDYDYGMAIVLDDEGNSYIVGQTESSDFPTQNAMNETHNGNYDIFLSKISLNGTLIYSTYIGGPSNDYATDLAIDSSGNLYICGYTYSSTGFPLKNAYNSTHSGDSDAFIMKLNNDGNQILYSTYLGALNSDVANGIEVDEQGNSYITGYTYSSNFPNVSGFSNEMATSPDVFLSKLSPEGNNLLYSSFLGGNNLDMGFDLALDSDGYCYIVGTTSSTDFPTQNPMNSSKNSFIDMFITKMKPGEPSLNYSTYFGSGSNDEGWGVAVDSSGVCYITGWAYGSGYPLKNEIQDYQGNYDIVVTAINYTGTNVLFSTYLGSPGADKGYDITLGPDGHVHITGLAGTDGLPVKNAYDSTFTGTTDGVVAKFSLNGDQLEFCSYLSGTAADYGWSIAVHSDSTMFITGGAISTNFPIVNAFQETHGTGSNRDAFITRIGIDDVQPAISLISPEEDSISPSGTEVSLNIDDTGSGISHVFYYWDSGPNQTLESPYIEHLPVGEGSHTLFVFVNDSVGNWASDSFVLYTDDFAPEISLVTPLNNTIQQSSIIIDIDVDDTFLDTVMHAWDDDNPAEFYAPYWTSPATPDGPHFLHIIANDSLGRETHAYYTFKTDDTIPEVILQYPMNNTAHHSDAIVDLEIYDLHLDEILYHWDDDSSNHTFDEPYELFIPSGEEEHTLHVYVGDLAGNWNYSKYVFTVDDSLPGISHPSDIIMDEGDTGISIIWTPTSIMPLYYSITSNGTEIDRDSWTNGVPIELSLDGFAYGMYNITIAIFDEDLEKEKDWVWVNVVDGTSPEITSSPADDWYSEGSTGNELQWQAEDLHPLSFRVLLNGTPYTSGLWNSSDEVVTINIDGLSHGTYEFSIIFKDIDGNTNADIVVISVIDDTPPIIESPEDFAYVIGTTGNEIFWNIIENNPVNYKLYRNGTLITDIGWDGDPITAYIDGLGLGIYNYTLVVTDISNLNSIDTVWISVVVDETPPTIDNPPDTYYQVGTTGNNVTWTPEDEFPDHYEIFLNGTSLEEDEWDPEDQNITISIDGLEEGVYNVTIIVYDDGGNNATHTIWVTVVDDTTIPTIDSPEDVSYNEGTDGNKIVWTPDDAYPDSYTLYRNGSEIETGDWFAEDVNITVSIDGLEAGVYNFTITVYDVGSNNISDTVWVSVYDVTWPVIDAPADFSYAEGSTGNTITWTPSDLHPASYIVYRNGTEVESDDWTGESIIINVDGLSLGIHNHTIVVLDDSDNYRKDTVMVTVFDGTPPTINSPEDFDYDEGETGNEIEWIPSDLHPASYEVLLDGTSLISDDWTGEAIVVSIDGLVAGVYNFTVVVMDVGENSVSDSVIVTVNAASTPPSTTSTTPTEPPGGVDIVIIIVIAGAGGAILIIIIYACKKKK
jgi:hypothetical protein